MKFIMTHRYAFFIGIFGLFGSLLLHDWNLYPNLRPYGVPILSLLRLFLLAMPFVCGLWLTRDPRIVGIKRCLTWIVWLVFLPYTIYSVTEIRHIAEACRLARGVYTAVCIDRLWTLYPTFIYALAGLSIFVFTLSQVSAKLIPHSSKKRAFILAICFYASFASVFGLYTRFNMWDALTKPMAVFTNLITLLSRSSFYLNVLSYFLFTTILFFLLNRTLYRAHRYIFDEGNLK